MGVEYPLQSLCWANSKLQWVGFITGFLKFVSAKKQSLELQVVHIFFDTSTFDRVEKDVKVTKKQNRSHFINVTCLVRLLWWPNWVWSEAQWDSSLASQYSVELRFSTLLQSSFWWELREKLGNKKEKKASVLWSVFLTSVFCLTETNNGPNVFSNHLLM